MITDAERAMMARILTNAQGKTLRKGSGKDIYKRALQLFLRDQGYDIKADGIFGKNTEKALKDWQRKAGVGADGKAGFKTFGKIKTLLAMPTPEPRPDPAQVAAELAAQQSPPDNVGAPVPPDMQASPLPVSAGASADMSAPPVLPAGQAPDNVGTDVPESMQNLGPGGAPLRPATAMRGMLDLIPGYSDVARQPAVAAGSGNSPLAAGGADSYAMPYDMPDEQPSVPADLAAAIGPAAQRASAAARMGTATEPPSPMDDGNTELRDALIGALMRRNNTTVAGGASDPLINALMQRGGGY